MSYCLSNISTLCFRVHVSANTYEARSVGVINDKSYMHFAKLKSKVFC